MTVNFTTNLGLAKPTQDEIARLWAEDPPALAADNNEILNPLIDRTIQTYVVDVTADTTNPDLGSGGVNKGRFRAMRLGSLEIIVTGEFAIRIGSSPDPGLGVYNFTLPVRINGNFHRTSGVAGNADIIGEGMCTYLGSSERTHIAAYASGHNPPTARLLMGVGFSGLVVSHDSPAAIEVNDEIACNFFYIGRDEE